MCSVARTQICPKCRAILEPGTRTCPYCATDQRYTLAPSASEDALSTARLGMWIIGINLVVYVLMVLLDPARGDAEGIHVDPSPYATRIFGLSDYFLVAHCGQYWRLLTAVFLHLDVLHLVLNCACIYILTPLAASTFGAHRTTCLYLVAGVLGALASHLGGVSGAGASGAVCGLIGALMAYGHRRRDHFLRQRMFVWAMLIAVWGIVMPRIDNVAHGGGFAAGAALGWLGAAVRARGGRADRLWKAGAIACVAGAVATAAIGLVPFVLRSRQRREVILYRGNAERALEQVGKVLEGRASSSSLPETFEEGPAGSEALREALLRALAAARTSPRAPLAVAAYRECREAFAEWEVGLVCSHAIWREGP